ncbi:MAG: hypothetical protein J3T61_02860, partial [Candidatus Brocadiales bacterium]|nr:hypothetical protein [Candidatus Bathyanammoxibius sp.]
SLEKAAKKSKIFINYVNRLPETPTAEEGEIVAKGVLEEFGGFLIDGAFRIWKGLREADREKREEVIKALDELKWPYFADIQLA